WLRSLSSNAGSLATSLRSHACGQLSSSLAGQPATLCGWLARLRNRGQFALLRDRYGTVQVVPANPAARAALRSAPLESTLQVSGLVQLRPERDRNPSMPTGEIELVADTVTVMGPVANEAVPLLPQNADRGMPETRLKYRLVHACWDFGAGTSADQPQASSRLGHQYRLPWHLALRSDSMQCRLELRSSLLHSLRRFLVEQHRFVELETPTLFRATPGGAREFVVPARLHRGRGERCQGYSLVQSPQQLKQLLMMAGFDRYFQLARCYRDESGRPDRAKFTLEVALEEAVPGEVVMTGVELPGAVSNCRGVRGGVAKGLQGCWAVRVDDDSLSFHTFGIKFCSAGTDSKDFVLEDRAESASVLGMRGNDAALMMMMMQTQSRRSRLMVRPCNNGPPGNSSVGKTGGPGMLKVFCWMFCFLMVLQSGGWSRRVGWPRSVASVTALRLDRGGHPSGASSGVPTGALAASSSHWPTLLIILSGVQLPSFFVKTAPGFVGAGEQARSRGGLKELPRQVGLRDVGNAEELVGGSLQGLDVEGREFGFSEQGSLVGDAKATGHHSGAFVLLRFQLLPDRRRRVYEATMVSIAGCSEAAQSCRLRPVASSAESSANNDRWTDVSRFCQKALDEVNDVGRDLHPGQVGIERRAPDFAVALAKAAPACAGPLEYGPLRNTLLRALTDPARVRRSQVPHSIPPATRGKPRRKKHELTSAFNSSIRDRADSVYLNSERKLWRRQNGRNWPRAATKNNSGAQNEQWKERASKNLGPLAVYQLASQCERPRVGLDCHRLQKLRLLVNEGVGFWINVDGQNVVCRIVAFKQLLAEAILLDSSQTAECMGDRHSAEGSMSVTLIAVELAAMIRPFLTAKPLRQPEFTQLDLEMSFADDSDILPLVEAALLAAWPTEFNGERLPRPPSQPFQRISYADAMLRYGTDKPDTRFGLTAQRWTLPSSVTVVGFRVSADELTDGRQLTLPAVDALRQALAESPLAAGWQLSDGKTFRNETLVGLADCCGVADDDLVLHGPESQIGSQVAAARLALHSALVSTGSLPALDWRDWRLIWVDQFPLFEADNDSNSRLRSCHHPFTAPVPEHLDGLLSGELPPAEVIGRHFDLVCNGCELGGGSVRIHDPRLQKLVLEKVLGLDPEPMRHLIEALGHGAPPHVGIALGVDRLVSLLTGADCIADCMAFPKTQEGRCLLSGAPALIDANTLDYYRLRPAAEQTDCSN
uniref:AA_TRNA_LIGASE_II domain-containing protein n=1 Tax=Macrostomum lignano TaxID=282301 RepID=A0A1I8J6I7_9PLAT